MNALTKKIPRESLFAEYTKILNGVLGLSAREALVFSLLLEIDSASKLDNINTKPIRTFVMGRSGISEANLSRYLGVLKDKGLLIKGPTNKWVINDVIRPKLNGELFEFKFVLQLADVKAGHNN